jgi:HD-GYP domain-containing protein (c-di-GMP phosphodiesterase class II)
MVEFRDLFQKPKAPKKKAAVKTAPKSVKDDRFSFKSLVFKNQEKSKANKNRKKSDPATNKKQVPKKRGFLFSDIVPAKKTDTAVHPQEQIAIPQESDKKESHHDIENFQDSLIAVDEVLAFDVIPQLPPEVEKRRQLLYDEAAAYLREVFETVGRRRKFSLPTGLLLMNQMVETQPPYDPLFINAIHQDNPGEYIIFHSVNVSIFAIKIAQYLGHSEENQEKIGMAGLLHDVGASLVPKDILYKEDALTQKEITLLQQRPLNAYKILTQFGDEYKYLADCAYQVYERLDGSGYPNGLRGDEINEYAQIIGLLDIYEALIHSRPQRVKFLHFNAVKEIIKTYKKGFKKEHLKALLNTFSIFPLSTYVRLNSNSIGKVIETYPAQPLRPKIKIEFDSQNQKVLTDRVVDLSENTLLHIIDSVSEEEFQLIPIK